MTGWETRDLILGSAEVAARFNIADDGTLVLRQDDLEVVATVREPASP